MERRKGQVLALAGPHEIGPEEAHEERAEPDGGDRHFIIAASFWCSAFQNSVTWGSFTYTAGRDGKVVRIDPGETAVGRCAARNGHDALEDEREAHKVEREG
jgi:hypothetical protein